MKVERTAVKMKRASAVMNLMHPSQELLSYFVRSLVDTVPNLRLGILPIGVRVGVAYTERTESPLQVEGCNAVFRDQFWSSLVLLLIAFDVSVKVM